MANEWISKNAKLIFKTNIISQLVIFVTYAVVVVFLDCYPNDMNSQELYRWSVLLLAYISQLHFALHSVVKSNMAEIKAFFIVALLNFFLLGSKLVLATIAITVGKRADECKSKGIVITFTAFAALVLIANQVFFYLAARSVAKEYEWNALYKVGPDGKTNANFFFVDDAAIWYILDGVFVVVVLAFTDAGYQSFRYKRIGLFRAYLVLYALAILYQVSNTVEFIIQGKKMNNQYDYQTITANQIGLCVCTFGVTLYVLIEGFKVFKMEGEIQEDTLKRKLLAQNESTISDAQEI